MGINTQCCIPFCECVSALATKTGPLIKKGLIPPFRGVVQKTPYWRSRLKSQIRLLALCLLRAAEKEALVSAAGVDFSLDQPPEPHL